MSETGIASTFAVKFLNDMETNPNYVIIAIQLLGSLGLLIYGMRMMSEAL